ncbi:MAG: M20/M25/M40 family metallo-hydrolase [Promethearchaeota archaeon]
MKNFSISEEGPKTFFVESLKHVSEYKSKFLNILEELVKFPTVAFREPEGIQSCADYLEELLEACGYKASQYPTGGSPVVYGEKNVSAAKTLMFYNHYDVQPEDPLDLWHSSPWKLSVRDERAYGRGTVDDKGPFIIELLAIQFLEDLLGTLPVNVKFIIEGEEEAGSNNLGNFTTAQSDLLKADGCVWEGAFFCPQKEGDLTLPTPISIVCGLKGNAYFELIASDPPKFPSKDVHSGLAGAVPNAAHRLVWALGTLKDTQENILIEGFNELVSPPLEEDLAALKDFQGNLEEIYKKEYELDQLLLNRSGLDFYQAAILGATLSICGLTSGFQDEGSKTIIPAKASAKLDIRLVPNLTMKKVDSLLRAHLKKKGFDDIKVKLITGYDPAKTPVSHPFIRGIEKLCREIFTPTPVNVMPLALGSGPAYLFGTVPLCLSGNSAEGTNGHAPNENIPLVSVGSSLAFVATLAQELASKEN